MFFLKINDPVEIILYWILIHLEFTQQTKLHIHQNYN
nr:MAG TPA: hypothetical protein [Caudoviricetes sp.]